MVEAAPIQALGDAEPLQRRSQRAAGKQPGEIMRAGVEAVEAGLPEMARLAQEGVAIAARHDMGLEDRDLQSGVGEQRRRGQAADPGADDRHVDRVLGPGAAELRAPASDRLGRVDPVLHERADEEFRAEDRDQSPEGEEAGRRQRVRRARRGPARRRGTRRPRGRK